MNSAAGGRETKERARGDPICQGFAAPANCPFARMSVFGLCRPCQRIARYLEKTEMDVLDRRRFLQTTTTTIGATVLSGCGTAEQSSNQSVKESPAMQHERGEQLYGLYGIRFPNDFFEFWEWYNHLHPDSVKTFHEELSIRLVGPFDVLAGKFDNVHLRYPAVLHWRYQYDPPEFFTVFSGNTDGLHWGYWFDDPGRLPPVISAFYASDAFELWSPGSTLFDAVAAWIKDTKQGIEENIEYDPGYADDYRSSLKAVMTLEQQLPGTSFTTSRNPTHQTPELMGVVIPSTAGKAEELLLRGKQLWFDGDQRRFDVLAQAYDELGRTVLANVVRTHKKNPRLPRLDMLEYRIGDYHSIEEALAEAEQVIRLEIGNAGMNALPDMSVFPNLEKLSLWGNALTDLPPSLVECRKLKAINLHRNLLNRFPKVLFELVGLEELILGQNKVTAIDNGERKLPSVKVLLLIGNPIPDSQHDKIREMFPNAEITF